MIEGLLNDDCPNAEGFLKCTRKEIERLTNQTKCHLEN